MPGRSISSGSYRYGFNGKENDNDVKGTGNQQDYGMRIYDPRLGRFLSVDPLQKQYPYYTPYQFSGNTPIQATDLDGLEEYHYTLALGKQGQPQLTHVKTVTEKSFLFWSYTPPEKRIVSYNGETFEFSAGGYGTSPLSDMGANSYENFKDWLRGGYKEEGFDQAFYSTYATNILDAGSFAEGISTDIAVGKGWAKSNAHPAENGHPAASTNKQVTAANNGNGNAASSNTATSKTPVQPYEVGEFSDLQKRSVVGDQLDLHHVPQKSPAGQVVPGYDARKGTAIALPETVHNKIPTQKGPYKESPRKLLAKDAKDLRRAGVPSVAVKEVVNAAKKQHPQAYRKK